MELSQAQEAATAAEIGAANARYDELMQRALLDYQVGELAVGRNAYAFRSIILGKVIGVGAFSVAFRGTVACDRPFPLRLPSILGVSGGTKS